MHYLLLIVILAVTTSSEGIRTKHKLKECYENLCSNGHERYPTNRIKKLLNKYKQSDLTMEETVIEPRHEAKLEARKRSVTSPVQENLCQSTLVTIFPKFDRQSNLTIVNIKGHYQQKIVFEKCVNASGRCKRPGVLDYEMSCKQLYNNVRLLYVDGKNRLRNKLFQVPNTCVCVYKKSIYKKED